jgi:hypothetical protein
VPARTSASIRVLNDSSTDTAYIPRFLSNTGSVSPVHPHSPLATEWHL